MLIIEAGVTVIQRSLIEGHSVLLPSGDTRSGKHTSSVKGQVLVVSGFVSNYSTLLHHCSTK